MTLKELINWSLKNEVSVNIGYNEIPDRVIIHMNYHQWRLASDITLQQISESRYDAIVDRLEEMLIMIKCAPHEQI